MSTTALKLAEIFDIANACLKGAGANEANARAVARTVMTAERDGSGSHGLFRMPGYVAALKSGKVNGNADPVPEHVSDVVMRCDGQNGYAPLAHTRCLNGLASAAKKHGLAVLALHRSHHFAALWPEVEALAEQGLAAMTCVSYMPAVAPSGGAEPLFGTNPFAFAWPRENETPMVIDMATAAMAKIMDGVILPFGGYKGSAMAMMIELLAGPMVGEAFSFETKERDNADGGPPQGGQFILAMSPTLIGGGDSSVQCEGFFARLAGMKGVRIPGQRRHTNRLDQGTRDINTELVEKLKAMA